MFRGDEYGDTIFEEEEPYGILPYSYQDIQSFIRGRKAPSHRKHIASLMANAGIRTDVDYILFTKALSLNDTVWVKQQGSRDTWREVSLYRNSFNEVIARTAFDGVRPGKSFSQISPEYSTEGLYAKCWTRFHNNIFLVKKPPETYGTEIFSEVMASELAEYICPHSVSYHITEHHGKQVSIFPIFTSEETGFIPAYKFISSNVNISKLLEIYSRYGTEEEFRRMLVFDALILNEDRHAGNYGFLFDNDTGRITGMNPIFDHNRSLLFDLKDYDIPAIREKNRDWAEISIFWPTNFSHRKFALI